MAVEWLAELDVANTPRAAKMLLRERTEERRGIRPSIGPAEVRESGQTAERLLDIVRTPPIRKRTH